MTLDLWTVFAAVALPYVPYLVVGFYKNRRGIYDPANPRDSNALLEGWSARAKGAEANSWEALAQYLGVTFVAYQAGADRDLLGLLGAAWVVARLGYYVVYIAGFGRVRVAVWALGLLLIVARFGVVFLPT
jgi:uncharacterized MAPEG superfamily protein